MLVGVQLRRLRHVSQGGEALDEVCRLAGAVQGGEQDGDQQRDDADDDEELDQRERRRTARPVVRSIVLETYVTHCPACRPRL